MIVFLLIFFWVGIPLFHNFQGTRSSKLKITCLSAKGEAVLVEAPYGKKILINLSENSQEVERVILPFLYKKGINQLDGLILTEDEKLEEKLSELIREIKVKKIWAIKEYISVLKNQYGSKTSIFSLEELNQSWGKVKVLSIYPDKKSMRGTDLSGPFLTLSYGKFKLWMAERIFPESLAIRFKPDIVSFNPGDEGLGWSNIFALEKKLGFRLIISGYDKPGSFWDSEEKIFQTSKLGAVSIEVDGEKYKLKTVLGKKKIVRKL